MEETPRQILFALCWRGGEGALDKIKILYDSKQVQVDEVDENRVTALRFAAQYDHPEIVTYLLSMGSSTKIKAKDGIDPATRTFQGLRIHVNDELGELERGLEAAERLLSPEGRLVVVSFHSLEDRMVKRFMRAGNMEGEIAKDFHGRSLAPFDKVTGKAIVADAMEMERNPRSRSARMRIAARNTLAA